MLQILFADRGVETRLREIVPGRHYALADQHPPILTPEFFVSTFHPLRATGFHDLHENRRYALVRSRDGLSADSTRGSSGGATSTSGSLRGDREPSRTLATREFGLVFWRRWFTVSQIQPRQSKSPCYPVGDADREMPDAEAYGAFAGILDRIRRGRWAECGGFPLPDSNTCARSRNPPMTHDALLTGMESARATVKKRTERVRCTRCPQCCFMQSRSRPVVGFDP